MPPQLPMQNVGCYFFMTPKPILKYIGLTLLILGTILNISMYIEQAWPTYLFFITMAVGLFLFLLSFVLKNLNTWWQVFICLIPFIVAYISFDISSPSKDIFLIPKGFTGQVTIYYSQPDGQKTEFEGSWRIYRIPINGHLETQFNLKGHVINLSNAKYFYVDSNNKKLDLRQYCDACNDRDSVSVQVINPTLEMDNHGTYQTFYVDRPMDRK